MKNILPYGCLRKDCIRGVIDSQDVIAYIQEYKASPQRRKDDLALVGLITQTGIRLLQVPHDHPHDYGNHKIKDDDGRMEVRRLGHHCIRKEHNRYKSSKEIYRV